MALKDIARSLCPSPVWNLLARASGGHAGQSFRDNETFGGVYATFGEVEDQKPWTSAVYLDACRHALRHHEQAAASSSALSTQSLLAFIINSFTEGRTPRVLDWAGGTGLRYWTVRPGLKRPVQWLVVDDPKLAAIGREMMGPADQPEFADVLPPASTAFDIVLIYASLHYVEAQIELLRALVAYRPQYIVLSRLMALGNDSYVTQQDIIGLKTPCKVSNLQDIAGALQSEGYKPILMVQDGRDLTPLFCDDVPPHRRVGKEWLAVFRSEGGQSSPRT